VPAHSCAHLHPHLERWVFELDEQAVGSWSHLPLTKKATAFKPWPLLLRLQRACAAARSSRPTEQGQEAGDAGTDDGSRHRHCGERDAAVGVTEAGVTSTLVSSSYWERKGALTQRADDGVAPTREDHPKSRLTPAAPRLRSARARQLFERSQRSYPGRRSIPGSPEVDWFHSQAMRSVLRRSRTNRTLPGGCRIAPAEELSERSRTLRCRCPAATPDQPQ